MKQLVVALFTVSIAMNTNAIERKLRYTAEEINKTCEGYKTRFLAAVDEIATSKEKPNYANTITALERASSEFDMGTALPLAMSNIHPEKDVRDAASACEEAVSNVYIDVTSRTDLFKRVEAVKKTPELATLSKVDQKLFEDTYKAFLNNGLGVKDAKKRAEIKQLLTEITKSTIEFEKNVAEGRKSATFTRAELDGLDESWIAAHEASKDANGNYVITTDYPDYVPFMKYAKNEDARKRLYTQYQTRGGQRNVDLLEDTLAKRRRVANLMGFASHADRTFALSNRMVTRGEQVAAFLNDLNTKLIPYLEKDLASMRALKCKELNCVDSTNVQVQPWDGFYYINQMEKAVANLNDEKIMEYFPLDTVTAGMFDIYQNLLGLKFVEFKTPNIWYQGVRSFHVYDRASDNLVGTFYLDMFPRDGKYKHAAVMGLIGSKQLVGDQYQPSLAIMMCNFTPPADGKPSLLTHDEVETYFHEFGHVMDKMATKVKYSSHNGTPRDFVEAPSQMLENWVWNEEGLSKLSGHYETGEKLPTAMLQDMLKLKNVANGYKNSVQVFYSSVDLEFHSGNKVDSTTATWARMYKKMVHLDLPQGVHPQSSFGHIMSGYSAGYYGYLWSKVYAEDMFSVFESEGILNPEIGMRYRKEILEPSGSRSAFDSLEAFLGRKPNAEAFIKSLGLEAN